MIIIITIIIIKIVIIVIIIIVIIIIIIIIITIIMDENESLQCISARLANSPTFHLQYWSIFEEESMHMYMMNPCTMNIQHNNTSRYIYMNVYPIFNTVAL